MQHQQAVATFNLGVAQLATIIDLRDACTQSPLLVHVESVSSPKPCSTVKGPIIDVMHVIGEAANHGYDKLVNFRVF